MNSKILTRAFTMSMAVLLIASAGSAFEMIFPGDANVITVTEPPYSADNSGATPVQDIINQIIADRNLHPDSAGYIKGRALYFPNGTYLVTDTIKWGQDDYPKNKIQLIGQDRDNTIIKLQDNCPGYNQVPPQNDNGYPVIRTGSVAAQAFQNHIINMTINTGSGNVGAIGVQFDANNDGSMRNVKIISEDGQGMFGVDMGFVFQNGPNLLYKVEIDGFNIGIYTGKGAVNSMAFEDIVLRNQRQIGFKNVNQTVSIHGLKSYNNVCAIQNHPYWGNMTLIDAVLEGGTGADSVPAIRNLASGGNEAALFARNVTTSGYSMAIYNEGGNKQNADGPDVNEFVSHEPVSFYGTQKTSLNLEKHITPYIPWETDTANWANVVDFGAIPDSAGDDFKGIQDAINSGATTVYFPRGGYSINSDSIIKVGGNVKFLIGFWKGASVGRELPAFIGMHTDVKPVFHIIDGNHDTLVIDGLSSGSAPKAQPAHLLADKVVIMLDCGFAPVTKSDNARLFLSNCGGFDWRFERGKVWAHGCNVENDWQISETMSKLYNGGAHLWICGLKTEAGGCIVKTEAWQDGPTPMTEVLGGLSHTNRSRSQLGLTPMFLIDRAVASIVFNEVSNGNRGYNVHVHERRAGFGASATMCTDSMSWDPQTGKSAFPGKQSGVVGRAIPLYSAQYPDNNNVPNVCYDPKPAVKKGLEAQHYALFNRKRFTYMPGMASNFVITVPKGIRGFAVFSAQGRLMWKFERNNIKKAVNVSLPAHVKSSVCLIQKL
ncbi:MAG: hypothetical protein GF398_08895 [Chitinivibrionales bacterium]|nr:hypothetical protein [Chitinivibrionales bacterium]